MEEDLITVVIAVYNTENYIDKCIRSIIGQSYKNLEIIIVNDGSTDNSINKCRGYNDSRIKIIDKKNNEGLSVARNIGIEAAKGKYISFVDSDDVIEDDYIEYLYKLIKKYNTRLSICSYLIHTKKKVIHNGNKYLESVLNTEKAFECMLCDNGFSISAWGKMYEKSLFADIVFPEEKFYEDTAVTYKIIRKCDKIAYGYKEKYIYNKRENSITNSEFNMHRMDVLELTDKMVKDINMWYPSLKNATNRRILYANFSVLRYMVNAKNIDKKLKKKIRNKILKSWKQFIINPKIQLRDRIAFIALLLGEKAYKFSWNIYCKIKY